MDWQKILYAYMAGVGDAEGVYFVRYAAQPNRVERNLWGDIRGTTEAADNEVMKALAGVLAGD